MRARRGNYAILFVLTFTTMLAYLAFSIDGGRVKVAALNAENAAEAAALAAVAARRDGASRGAAEARAAAAASAINILGKAGKGSTVRLDIRWGEWDWDVPREQAGDRWSDTNSPQAITVNATVTGGGVTSIFGPAIQLAASRGSQAASLGGSPRDGVDYSKMAVTTPARAAMRHRDIVLAVDASRFTDPLHVEDIQDGLVAFLDELEELGIPGERLALVAYAGDAWNYDLLAPEALDIDTSALQWAATSVDMGNTLYRVDAVGPSARATAGRFELCDTGIEAWYFGYRHRAPTYDWELDGAGTMGAPPQWDYRVINHNQRGSLTWQAAGAQLNANLYAWLRESTKDSVTGQYTLPSTMEAFSGDDANDEDGMLLTVEQQCAIWTWTEIWYALADQRRARANASLATSPLPCHFGNYFEGDPNRFFTPNDERAIAAVDCSGFNLGNIPGTTVPRYAHPEGDARAYQDRSYLDAGSNPGRAFERAVNIFNTRNSYGHPTVVLVSESAARCGLNLENDPDAVGACEIEMDDEVATFAEQLDRMDTDTHVVAITQPGSVADIYLGSLQMGRGLYRQADGPAALDPVLREFAREVRVQVVQ